MGNKQSSRRKSASDLPDGGGGSGSVKVKKGKRNKHKKNGVSDIKNNESLLPEIDGGAIPYSKYQDEPELDIKLYRSYGNLATSKFGSMRERNPMADVRVYRRSVAGYPAKTQTLPRNFGRPKSDGSALPNGTLPLDSGERRSPDSDDRNSKRSSTSSLGQKVQMAYNDFPSTRDIIRKLNQFEEHFARLLTSKYRRLPEALQLSCMSIALKLTKTTKHTISLYDYLETQSVPEDLAECEEGEEYVLKVPAALFQGIAHVRRDKIADPELWRSLARDLAMCVAVEAANEISRIFEYQIALLNEEASIRMLAAHAADCAIDYLKAGNRYLDRNTAIIGVLKGRPHDPVGYPRLVSVIIGSRELKWELDDILKLPALRRETLVYTDDVEIDDDCPPWEYYTSNHADPMLYGYRGLILEWDFVNRVYRVYRSEEKLFPEEMMYRYDDFHRAYLPYRRLIGAHVMENYCRERSSGAPGSPRQGLAEYLTQAVGSTYSRDEMQPVYRPLAVTAPEMAFDNAILDNVDLTRMQLDRADLRRASVRNSKLILADASEANLERTPVKGADMSYSNVDGASMEPEKLGQVTARHVALSERFQPVAKRLFTDEPQGETHREEEREEKKVEREINGYGGHNGEHAEHEEEKPALNGHSEEITLKENVDVRAKSNGHAEEGKGQLDARPQENGHGEEEEEAAPLWEATKPKKKGKKRRSRIISDSEGKITTVDEAIVQKQKDIAEGKENEPEPEVDSTDAPSPNLIVVEAVKVETTTAAAPGQQPVKLRKKRKKRLNTSFNSEGAASQISTDFNLLDTSQDSQQSAGPRRPASAASSLPSRSRRSPPGGAPATVSAPVEEVVRPSSAAPAQSQAEPAKVRSTTQRQAKAMSTTNIHLGHSGRPNRISPPARGLGPAARMSKSFNHHNQQLKGKSASVSDAYALGFVQPGVGGFYNSRRVLSQAELEYIRRSQVFTMIKGLQIPNIESNLPEVEAAFTGREQEVAALTELVTSGRVVTVTGCYGVGKSALAVSVGHLQQKKFICPVVIDLRGAVSTSSVIHRVCSHFRLHFKQNELHMLYNWLNCHEQRLLFVLDNVEAPPAEDERLSDFLDDMMFNVKDLRILCTTHRCFFRGQSSSEVYHLGALPAASEALLEAQLPDLHAEGRQALAEHASHVPWAVRLVCAVFKLEDVDTGALAESLMEAPGPVDKELGEELNDVISGLTDDDDERAALGRVAACLARVLAHIPENFSDLLRRVSRFAASFDTAAAAKLTPGESDEVSKLLDTMAATGLVHRLPTNGSGDGRYIVPAVVKMTVLAQACDNGLSRAKYVGEMVESMKVACGRYHSRECRDAIADFAANLDNYADALTSVMTSGVAYETCGSFCSLEYAIFLSQNIFDDTYVRLYDTIAAQSAERDDPRRQSLALCCLAYHHVTAGHVEKAKLAVEKAYGVIHDQPTLHELDKAFCLYCMGLVHWENPDEQHKALMLAKKALDIFKLSLGVRSLRTLYVNEKYGWMLTRKESHQTARHFYNISDFVVRETLAEHPVLIPGFDCRREIWDRLCLFARATDTAKLAYDVSREHYGDHPTTATMAQNHCEAIIKRGSLNDAISAAVSALAVRCRVLGDHEDTAHSYKVMAYLMLRSGQYDEAVRFGQSAAEIYEQLDANERLKIEVRNIMAQARYRLEYKSSNYIQLESKNAARKASSTPASPMDDTMNTTIGSLSTSFSTEV